MLIEMFLIFFAIGFISFLIGLEKEIAVYHLVSLFMYIITLASALYIEVGGSTLTYIDYTASAVSLGFIFLNIIYVILCVVENSMEAQKNRKFRFGMG
jgi:hypothetical protein